MTDLGFFVFSKEYFLKICVFIPQGCSDKLFLIFFHSRVLKVNDSDDDPSTTDSSSSDDEAHLDLKTLSAQGDLPQDFWQVGGDEKEYRSVMNVPSTPFGYFTNTSRALHRSCSNSRLKADIFDVGPSRLPRMELRGWLVLRTIASLIACAKWNKHLFFFFEYSLYFPFIHHRSRNWCATSRSATRPPLSSRCASSTTLTCPRSTASWPFWTQEDWRWVWKSSFHDRRRKRGGNCHFSLGKTGNIFVGNGIESLEIKEVLR